MSACWTVYVWSVAPGISAHVLALVVEHRFHWYANVGAGLPDHAPGPTLNLNPAYGAAEIAGALTSAGADKAFPLTASRKKSKDAPYHRAAAAPPHRRTARSGRGCP